MLTRLLPATLFALAFAFACNSTDSGDDLGDLSGARDTLGVDLRLDTGLGDQPRDLLGDVGPGDALDTSGDAVINMIGGTSNCCTEHPTPGCSDPAAQSQVCMAYTHCCSTTWDMMCAMFAQNLNLCQPAGGTCGDATCTLPSENCSTCPADCACVAPSTCYINTCCSPNCAGKDCGDNGCGSDCGGCDGGFSCVANKCQPDCVPNCAARYCGDNGCGGSCGTCGDQNPCTDDSCSASFHCQFLNDDTNPCDDGNACTMDDSCIDGTCQGGGLDPACSLAVDLGAPLGVMTFPQALGGGCFQGSKAFAPEAGLPFALLNGKACKAGDVVVSVELWADASFGKLGGATLAGAWEDDGVWCLHGDLATKPLPKFPGSFAGAAAARMCVAEGAAEFGCVLTDAAVLPHAPSIKFNPLEGTFTLVGGLWTLKFEHSVSMLALLPWASAPLNGLFARQGIFTLSADGQGAWSNELMGLVPVKAGTADLEMWLRGPLTNTTSVLKGQKPEGLSVAGLGYQAPHFDTADVVLTVDHLAMTARVDFFGFGDIVLFGRGLDLSAISGGGPWGAESPVALECAFTQESADWLEATLATQLGFQFVMEGEPCLAAGYGNVTAQACGQPVVQSVQLFGKTGLPLKLGGKVVQGNYQLTIEDTHAAVVRAAAPTNWFLAEPQGIIDGVSCAPVFASMSGAGFLPVKATEVLLEGHLKHINLGSFEVQRVLRIVGPRGIPADGAQTLVETDAALVPSLIHLPLLEPADMAGLQVQEGTVQLVLDPLTNAALGLRYQGPATGVPREGAQPVALDLKYYEDLRSLTDRWGQRRPSPLFFSVKPPVTAMANAVDWIRTLGAKDLMDVCLEADCGSNDRLSLSPLQITPLSLDLRGASITSELPPEAQLGIGLWTQGLQVALVTWLDGQKVTLSGLALAGGLTLTARVTPTNNCLPTLFPGGAGPGLTHNPVNRVGRATEPLAGKMISINEANPFFGAEGTVKAWVKNDSWSPRAYIIDRVAHDVLEDTALEISIYGAGGQDGRLRMRYVGSNGTESLGISRDAVIPRGKLTFVAVTWNRNLGRVGMFVDGKPVAVDVTVKTDVTIPTKKRFLVGTRLQLLDDLEWWGLELVSPDALLRSKNQDEAVSSFPDLNLWLRFDADGPTGLVFEERRNFEPVYLPGAGAFPWTADDDVYLMFDLQSWAGDGQPGFWIQSGVGLHLPGFPGGGLPAAAAQVRVGDGKAEGTLTFPTVIPLMPVGGPGEFVLAGRTDSKRATDGLPPPPPEALVDLVANSFNLEGTLAFQRPNGELVPLLPARASFTCPKGGCDDAFADALLYVLADSAAPPPFWLGGPAVSGDNKAIPVGLILTSGNLSFEEKLAAYVLNVSGKLLYQGLELASNAIKFTSSQATLASTVDLGKLFGTFAFGATKLDLTLKYADWSLCGKGTKDLPQGNCVAEGCFGDKGFKGKVVCNGQPACGNDGDCGAGKYCLGFLCADKLNDFAACLLPNQCKSGNCAGICYTPGSRAEGQTCAVTALDQCTSGLFCGVRCLVGNMSCSSVCMGHVSQGAPCFNGNQCPNGLECRMPFIGSPKLCLGRNLDVGERCALPNECRSTLCFGGVCRCGPADCPLGEFCSGSGTCATQQPNGADCCAPFECASGRCSTTGCILTVGGGLRNKGRCFAPYSVPIGGQCWMPDQCQKGFCGWDQRCRCTGPSDCPGQRCDVASGRCQNRLADGSFCLFAEDCQSGHCGTLFTTLPQCYTPGTRSMGEFCLAVDHCNGLACEPRCNWTLLDFRSACHPWNVMMTYSLVITAQTPPAGIYTLEAVAECGCETRCTCNDNGDCDADKYCGDLNIDGMPSGGLLNECRPRKNPAELCENNEECKSNDCSVCNFLGCACGCANSDQCWDGSYCSGNKCVPKKIPGLGCSGNVQCASGKCQSTFGGKVCVL